MVSEAVGFPALAQANRLLLVITANRILLQPAGRHDCELPQLMLLELLARGGAADVTDAVQQIAHETGVDAAMLDEFVSKLDACGLIGDQAATPSISAGSKRSSDPRRPSDPVGRIALGTPLILRLTAQGFEEHDHDGNLRTRLTARELVAACAFRTPRSFDNGLRTQQESLGALALEPLSFTFLVERLLEAGTVRSLEADDLAYRRGPQRRAARTRWHARGLEAVAAATARDMARRDAIEADRRSQNKARRTKIFPISAQRAAWQRPPLSLGMIMAYAISYKDGRLENFYDFRPDFLIDAEKIDRYSEEPGVYMFSSYVWTSEENLALSEQVKQRNSWNLTVHGGPDAPKFPPDVAAYFEAHPHVDVIVHGEGEITAAEMLDALAPHIGRGPTDLSVLNDVPGLSYRGPDGVVRTAPRDRLVDLDVIPSPYLTGLFDSFADGWRELVEEGGTAHFNTDLPSATIESNRGCPYGCTFCDWGSATLSRIRQFSIDRIYAELEWCAQNRVDAIGMADANFGILARDVDITKRVANLKRTVGFPTHFGTNYAKNTVKHLRQIVETLADVKILSYGLLSLQSMDADTLTTIDRTNIKLDKYEELAREFQLAELPLYVDLMMGLPGQTVRSFASDLQECVNREVHAKIFPTMLLVNSPMNEPSYREKHGIVAMPGERVKEAASFSRTDYAEMMGLRRAFMVLEKYGVLRFVMRYVRHETGARELDFVMRLIEDSRTNPQRWPLIHLTVEDLFRWMVPPVSWKVVLDEVRDYVVTALGVVRDDALDTVFEVQHALLPTRDRVFPCEIPLRHDFVAWHGMMLDAKNSGHLDDWETVVPSLRSLAAGVLRIDDPRDVCVYELGINMEDDPWAAWDLNSPVSRAVSSQV